MMTTTVPTARLSLARRALLASALIGGLTLTGCQAAPETDTSTGSEGAHNSDSQHEAAAEHATLEQGWAKAGDGMTGVFGTLTNPGTEEITLERASTPAADLVELHETVMIDGEMKMRELEGGFVIPAGGTFDLEPGGNHIMLMEMGAPIVAGEQITVTLAFSDGSTSEVVVDVRDYSGANENYHNIDGGDEHGGSHDEGHDGH